MNKIILIGCGKVKSDLEKGKAEEIYSGLYFNSVLKFAKYLNPDKIYILSGEYGLLELDDIISSYDISLNNFKKKERLEWSDKVINQLKNKTNIDKDKFIILAGNKYREFLLPHLKNYELPFKGLRRRQQDRMISEHLNPNKWDVKQYKKYSI